MNNNWKKLYATGILTLGFAWGYAINASGGDGKEKQIKPLSTNSTYASSAIDEIIRKADNDPANGLLEQRELVKLLKDLGYQGPPIPKYAVPFFKEGEQLEVIMYYGDGPFLVITLPKDKIHNYSK